MGNTTGSLMGIFIGLAICILLFLALRAIVLWYWKVDSIVDNQQKQILLLNKILESLGKARDNPS